MKRLMILPFVMVVGLAVSVTGRAEQFMPERLLPATENLVLNGQGKRTKLFLTMYDAGLYLEKKSTDAEYILSADQPMAIRLVIRSSLLTSEKMEKATLEGFARSTGGKTAAIEGQIGEFIAVFREEIKEKDIYQMIYFPSQGVKVLKNNREATVLPGLPFKKALFGIWLGSDPVQESLKKELLGG